MNEATPDQDRLLDEAIDLIIRHQNDADNPVALETIRDWRARSPDNEEVWQRVSKIHGASGLILTERRKIERREGLGLTRRNLMIGGLTTFGLGAAAYSFGPSLLLRTRADYMTAKGEIRRIDLPDGSVATLGPESAITLAFSDDARTVDLLAGMSFFEVAGDASRPFSVRSDAMHATALGTAFDVSDDAGVFSVGVDHGLVDVRAKADAPETIASLTANQWITIDPVSGDIDRGQREAGQMASWRDKLLIAERETVSALAARIGRWLPGRIIIADRLVGRQRVSGVFDLNDPLRALQAVVHPAGARVRQLTPYVTVVSSI
jgi:transmembrane sensor